MFTRLLVLLDHLAPDNGAFAYALEWAARWRLPIYGVLLPDANPERLATVACARAGVPWQLSPADRLDRLVGPGDLVVLGHTLPEAAKRRWLGQLLRNTGAGLLLCPDDWTPPGRLLLLEEGRSLGSQLVDTVESLCRSLPASPVVLTLGLTMKAAQRRQEAAREMLASRGLNADFDLIVGWNVSKAVLSAAAWRRCRLAVIDRPRPVSWWNVLGGSPTERLLSAAAPLAFLVLPEETVPERSPAVFPAEGLGQPRPQRLDPGACRL
jgi:hypothetical protein